MYFPTRLQGANFIIDEILQLSPGIQFSFQIDVLKEHFIVITKF